MCAVRAIPEKLRENSLNCIHQFILSRPECEEYDIIQALARSVEYTWPTDPLLSIFQKHFLVRHCLYTLNRSFQKEGRYSIDITPLRICVHRLHPSSSSVVGRCYSTLESFYLDQTHFFETDTDQVAELLAGFWRKFQAQDEKDDALALLGLEGAASWESIKSRYREMAMAHHPDRGGDEEVFRNVKDAFQLLKTLYKR